MEFMFFTNPQLFKLISEQEQEKALEEEISTVPPDLQELDDIISRMDSGAVLTFREELDENEGWV